jgi:hypothetical protein
MFEAEEEKNHEIDKNEEDMDSDYNDSDFY